MTQCAAKTKEGTQCQIQVGDGQKYCHIHRIRFVWRSIFSSLGVLGILGFIANLTGILGYFGINPPTSGKGVDDALSASPYQNAYLYLVSTNPSKETVLNGGDDIEYEYIVNYYVPNFDWSASGYQPRITVEVCKEPDDSGNEFWLLTDLYKAETSNKGEEKSVELNGKFIVPNTESECAVKVSLYFENLSTHISTNYKSQTIVIPYKVLKTNYELAYLQVVSASSNKSSSLTLGDEVKINFKVKYFVSEYEVQKKGFTPLISIGQVLSIDDYGNIKSLSLLDEPAEIGKETTKEFTVNVKVPDSAKLVVRILLVTDPKSTPSYQMFEFVLPFPQ